MRVTQEQFTPMRGHVSDGCVVDCNNGDVLTITPDMKGWSVLDQRGQLLGREMVGWEVAHLVLQHGKVEA